MNNFLIVESGIIQNIIVCEDEGTAKSFGAVPYYDNACIGDNYKPPKELTTEEKVQTLESQLKAAIQSNAMLEECLVELAGMVYA